MSLIDGSGVRLGSSLVALPHYAAISAAGSTNTVVAAVTGYKIRVVAVFVVSDDSKTVTFTDGVGGTSLNGAATVAANGGFALPFNPLGWFQASSGTILGLSLGAATHVGGSLTYILVPG